MNWYRWNAAVLIMILGIVAATIFINYRINFYGLFGDSAGKRYVVYDNDRATKYLFSYNYIPHNFDSLLIGSSISANWNTGGLTGLHMYNASLSGANISEEVLIVNKVLEQIHPKLTFIVIYPYLTATYGPKTEFMNPRDYWRALGSIQLFRGYLRAWLIKHGYLRREFDEFGTDDFVVLHLPDLAQGEVQAPTDYFVDPRAFEQYRAVLEKVRSGGARIVGIIPPLGMEYWKTIRKPLDQYCSKIRPFFHDDEPIIDLNSPEFDEFRTNHGNYQDEVHLSTQGARNAIQIINGRLNQLGLLDPKLVRRP